MLYSKSCSEAARNLIYQLLNITHAEGFGKYSKFSILKKYLRPANFLHLIDNMRAKLSNWKINFLSPAGRLTLIKTALNAIPTYSMQYLIKKH